MCFFILNQYDMDQSTLFLEKQWFAKQWWFCTICVITIVMAAAVIITRHNEVNPAAVVVGAGAPLLIAFFTIGMFHLTTRITTADIQISFVPFGFFDKKIPWESIRSAEMVTVSVLKQFGSPGVRYRGWFGFGANQNDRGYIVSGTKGLQLILKDGAKIYIGTRREKETEKILRERGVLK